MGSLSLLCEYDSSDEETLTGPSTISKLPLPNLPSYNIPRSISREPSDPVNSEKPASLRNFPHEPGNWATFVAIPIQLPPEAVLFLDNLSDKLSLINMKKVDDLHISLTRVLILRHHWISDFVKSVGEVISNTSPFSISLRGLSVYVNDNNSRTFVALTVEYGEDILNEVIDSIDRCLVEYKLPKYYSPRSLHLSVLWGAGNLKEKVDLMVKSITQELAIPVFVDSCYCKTGNKTFNLLLGNG